MSENQALPGSSSSMCPGCQGDGSLLLPCGHCLCPACLSLCQRELGKEQTGCTECVSRQLLDGVMKGLLDALFQGQPRRHPPETAEGIEEGGDVCREHGESRNVFCMEDEELICEQCQDEEHQDHECNSLEEATQECKSRLIQKYGVTSSYCIHGSCGLSKSVAVKMDGFANSIIRKWLGLPRCLSEVGLFGRKAQMVLEPRESTDQLVRPRIQTGRRWKAQVEVDIPISRLKHCEIVLEGRAGLGRTENPLVLFQGIQERVSRTTGHYGKVSQTGSCHDRTWKISHGRISFLIRTTHDTIPWPRNLHQWLGTEEMCFTSNASLPSSLDARQHCTKSATGGTTRELREAVWSLQEKLETLKKAKQSCQETTQHVRRQAQNTSRLIKQNFEKLHQFLRDEEISMLRKVSEEEEQKSRKLKERMDSLSEETRTLTEAVDSAEEAMSAPDRDFLKSYKVTSERMSSFCAEHPLELHGFLINEAKHLGSLRFRVWEKMQNVVSYTPVILDPNTADVCLSLSEDLTSLRFTDEEYSPHPKNPERFLQQQCVLACEGFLSGSNRWDVEVGDCTQWELGVMEMTDSIRTGCLCTLSLSEGVYKTNPPAEAPLKLRRKPQKVRVQVEYEIGRVTFSDATDNSIIYKIKQRFTEKVFPYFSNTCKRHPLQILSEKVSVYTE
ncbi:hypothetical protein DNTS_029625 [Danionella cerebrum]|uniref:B box-type domain-containing protein n=1 Tax=Danionella cerebrum TaxID=2873325 RepID=A0A553QJB5_9TELE|nr:hypothetical protein DNTS_029625 [Danionella translucida]